MSPQDGDERLETGRIEATGCPRGQALDIWHLVAQVRRLSYQYEQRQAALFAEHRARTFNN